MAAGQVGGMAVMGRHLKCKVHPPEWGVGVGLNFDSWPGLKVAQHQRAEVPGRLEIVRRAE